jgi:hypothetical protein
VYVLSGLIAEEEDALTMMTAERYPSFGSCDEGRRDGEKHF